VPETVSIPVPTTDAASYHAKGWWRDTTLLDDFLANVAERPDKIAIVADHAGAPTETLTFGQLGDIVDRIAAGLLELGVRPGEIVSFQLPNWWQFAAMNLAITRVGAVTNAILPILRHRELAFILERTGSRLCVVPDSFRGFDYAGMLNDVAASVPTLTHVFAVGAAGDRPGVHSFDRFFLERDPAPASVLDPLRPAGDDVAQVQFTSGTTGEPKGVVHTHNTVRCGTRSVTGRLGLNPDDALLFFSPLAHTVGYYFGCYLPLADGMTVVYQDAWDAEHMLDLVNTYQCVWTMAAPTFLADLCATVEKTGVTIPSMRIISCAGAPVPPPLIAEVNRRLGATVLVAWGMTEVGAVTTTTTDDPDTLVTTTDGCPPDWVELTVVDADGHAVPAGTPGRLLVRGASTCLTYFKRPDLFAAATHDGWLDTGDIAVQWDNGYIRIASRSKDLVIRGAENIPVVEVESALLDHPAVRDVAVIAVPDDRLGERACAVLVPRDPRNPPTLPELLRHLAELNMAKQFWPEYLHIIDALPTTATGKVQKFKLREDAVNWNLTLNTATTTPDLATTGES
jgi:cyclohexanecarboxylate-CoA ligase